MFTDAPCKGKTDLFYAQAKEGRGRFLFEVLDELRRMEEEAKAICDQCPYKAACLQIGLDSELYGIWGGTTPKERKQMRRDLKISLRRSLSMNRHKACGTEEGYQYCLEKGFNCDDCVEAHSVFLIGKPLTESWNPEAEHPDCGTEKSYQMLARRVQKRGGSAAGQFVRCEACKRAHKEFQKEVYRKRRMSGL